MPRTLFLTGETIASWPGVKVFQYNNGNWEDITAKWSWSQEHHQHYEVKALAEGSYWVPVSTNPPKVWDGATPVAGSMPKGAQPVDPGGKEYRPTATYIWIPNASIPANIKPGITSNSVICHAPDTYPPPAQPKHIAMLHDVLGDPPANSNAFSDSDGLISFVNLSSSFVQNNTEFQTGRAVCDMVANFFATMRQKVFAFLQANPTKVLAGDTPPVTQWDSSVTHYLQYMLVEAGGFADFQVTTETYSVTQTIVDFNTAIIKLLFDAVAIPENILTDVMDFVSGVGSSLRISWDDRSRNYATCLLGQCHEAVPTDNTGTDFVYFPKVKYYYISVNSSQQEFTSPCVNVDKITFNFQYDYYVTALKASVLDTTSTDYQNFTAFLNKAQGISYQDATNNLDAILDGTSSTSPQAPGLAANVFGVDITEYPGVAIPANRRIEQLLNREVLV